MRLGNVQVKKSAADDLRVCSEKSPNVAFERDTANSAALLNLYVIALGKARRILQGESPCRVRASHPPVSRLAAEAEPRERRTRQAKRRQRIL
jgi:hypothetical protein